MLKCKLLKGKMVENSISSEYLASELGINLLTLYRKMNGKSEFNRKELCCIKKVLNLSNDELDNIFFS